MIRYYNFSDMLVSFLKVFVIFIKISLQVYKVQLIKHQNFTETSQIFKTTKFNQFIKCKKSNCQSKQISKRTLRKLTRKLNFTPIQLFV